MKSARFTQLAKIGKWLIQLLILRAWSIQWPEWPERLHILHMRLQISLHIYMMMCGPGFTGLWGNDQWLNSQVYWGLVCLEAYAPAWTTRTYLLHKIQWKLMRKFELWKLRYSSENTSQIPEKDKESSKNRKKACHGGSQEGKRTQWRATTRVSKMWWRVF